MNKDTVMSLGLCHNLECVCISNVVYKELKDQFKDANLSPVYPFGENQYSDYSDAKSMHLDPNRVAWVQDHIDNQPEGQSSELTNFYKMWMFVRNDIIETNIANRVINFIRDCISNFIKVFK